MAGWSALHMSLAACLSSALTTLTILLLIRPGHENIVTHVVDRMRYSSLSSHSSPPTSPCTTGWREDGAGTITPWRQDLAPTVFVKAPWKDPLYGEAGSYRGGLDEEGFWEALLTPNGGFLDIDLQDGQNHSVGVSMRSAILHGGMHSQGQHTRAGRRGPPPPGKKVDQHIMHCFDYIAQAMLCAADDAVEGYVVKFDEKGMETDVIDGRGQVHQCRNATTLFDYVLQSERRPVRVDLLGEHSVFPD
ncbi:hypothetical protein ESCO_001437 [Escovopsis weberi]|uniref:Uncharacterized protein n=1 Tax=Escovopsis weberi TaxID=150374 RepID=A0A0M9VWP3_ESCWE|nr:hypothetical protein ESCO_001437 [Escovopsis weberi]